MYQAVNNTSPKPLQKTLTIENEFFFFEVPRIKQTRKSIYFAGPHIWSTLPTNLIDECDFVKFKESLKKHIISE